MHILESAMAAALLDRSRRTRPKEFSDERREGIRGLTRLALAVAAIALFCGAMEVVSRAASSAGAPRVAIERPG